MTLNNLTSLAWWQGAKTSTSAAPSSPTLTPEQTIVTALKSGLAFTQGNLLDLCRQHGAAIGYPALRSQLAHLQRQGEVRSSFTTDIIPGVPVLVYHRAARLVLPDRP